MSAFTLRSTVPARPTVLARLVTAVAAEWRAYTASRTLLMLDDHALRDIGVSRAEIGHAVRHGRN